VITLRVITLSDFKLFLKKLLKSFKENILYRIRADEAEDEVDVDVVVGCDMPMSIYLQPIIVITFVSKLLRSSSG